MKIGDYVRTSEGYISKYIGKNKTKFVAGKHLSFETTIRDIRYDEFDTDTMIWESEIEKCLIKIKSSPNIIDLIEEGDYVNGYFIEANKGDYLETSDIDEEYSYLGHIEYRKIYEKDIKTIVTKEQFESIEYKVVE